MQLEGQRLGKYILERQLGKGGMGIVFLAVQEGLDRRVALKILPEKSATNSADLLKRFNKEVSVCSRLSHRNIVKVFDYGYENGVYYYAMELLEATSLEDRLQDSAKIPFPEMFRIARDLVEAFRHYMPQGIVHRDLKPANIMMDASGTAIVTDFGLVKDLLATGITRVGVAVGTPYYMSPEMVYARPVGPPSDIFQFGVILYRMATGQLPFQGQTTGEVFKGILQNDPVPPSKLNEEVYASLENLILNCLVKDASGRYQDAEALAKDLAIASRKGKVLSLAQVRAASGVMPLLADPAGSSRAGAADPAAPLKPGSQVLRSGTLVRPGATRSRAPAAADRAAEALSKPLDAIDVGAGTPGWLSSGIWIGLLVILVPVVFAWVHWRGSRQEFAATDVVILAGVHTAKVSWKSPGTYAGRLDWGVPGGKSAIAEGPPGERDSHVVELAGLTPATGYRIQILFPDGGRSLEHTFKTQPLGIEVTGLKPLGTRWQLSFTTATPVLTTLRWRGGEVSDAAAATEHHLVAESFDPRAGDLSLSFPDAAGEIHRLAGAELLTALRKSLLVPLAAELARDLRAIDSAHVLKELAEPDLPLAVYGKKMSHLDAHGLEDMLTPEGVLPKRLKVEYYKPFKPGDPMPAAIAAKLTRWQEAQPFQPLLATYLRIGRDALDSPLPLPLETALALHEGLSRLRELEQYAAAIRIPYRATPEPIFRECYSIRLQPSLNPAAIRHERVFPGEQAFAAPWSEFQSVGGGFLTIPLFQRVPPSAWKFELPGGGRYKRAEVVLTDVFLTLEHRFAVTLNGRLKLRLPQDPSLYTEGRNRRLPFLAQQFDPRVLRDGTNEVKLEMEMSPGVRVLGIKNAYTAAFRLAAE